MKKKFPLQLVPSDAMLLAIGRVAAQWGYLEYEIDQQIKSLHHMGAAPGKDFGFQLSFKKRCREWRRAARQLFPTMLLDDVERVSANATAIKSKRDEIVHGIYSGGPRRTFQTVSRFAEIIEIHDTSTKAINAVAHEISEVGADMLTHVATVQGWERGEHPEWQPQPPQ